LVSNDTRSFFFFSSCNSHLLFLNIGLYLLQEYLKAQRMSQFGARLSDHGIVTLEAARAKDDTFLMVTIGMKRAQTLKLRRDLDEAPPQEAPKSPSGNDERNDSNNDRIGGGGSPTSEDDPDAIIAAVMAAAAAEAEAEEKAKAAFEAMADEDGEEDVEEVVDDHP
jgi:hypothetical protein